MLLGSWKNTFIGSWVPYPLQPDAYYYYSFNLPFWVVFIIPFICVTLGLIVFYYLCTNFLSEKMSLLGTISLSVLYPFFIQTYAGYTDTPSMIFMIMMFLIFWILEILKTNRKIYLIPIFLLIIILREWWAGWYVIPVVLSAPLFLILWQKLNKVYKVILVITTGILSLIILPFLIKIFIEFLSLFNVISELRPNWNIIWLIFNVLIFTVLFDLFKSDGKYITLRLPFNKYYIFSLSIIFTIMSMFMRRWTYLSMPFIVLVIFMWLGKRSQKALVMFMYFMIFLSVINTVITFSTITPLMDQESQEILNNLENRTILCNWASGHVYNLFTQGEVKNKGHPHEFDKWVYALENDSSVFSNMTENNYYIVFSKWDMEHLNNSMNYNIVANSSLITVYEARK